MIRLSKSELWGVLNKRISGRGEDRAAAIARTEAAFTQNKMLIRTILKAGYPAVWHTAPGCCALCQKMDGQVMSTLSPPLHTGCCCTVSKGMKNEVYNGTLPEDKDLKLSFPDVMLTTSDRWTRKSGGMPKTGASLHRLPVIEC